MKFVLMNQFFPSARAPTGMLLSDLAGTLRARGHEVEVICSEHRYGRATGLASKLTEYFAYYFRARRTLLRMNPPPDAVVSMTTPPFIGLTAAALNKKKKVPFMLWCMDLYPEALAAGGLLKQDGLLYRLLARMTAAERDLASCIVTLGPDMTRRLERPRQKDDRFFKAGGTPAVRIAGVPPADCGDSVPLNHRKAPGFDARIMEVPVWSRLNPSPADQAAARKLRKMRGWGDGEIICLYSGNMGRAHRSEEFAALAGRSIPNIRFVFCGTGPLKKEWQATYGTLFEWLDPVEENQLTAHLLSADIHLISQQPEWTGIVEPSKYQAACALERPVLFAGPPDCAVAGWIRQFGNGCVIQPGEPDAIERAAEDLGRLINVPQNPFDAESLKNRLAERLEQMGVTR